MWITNDDLRDRLSPPRYDELLDDDGDGAADEAIVARVIADAEGEANSYLSVRYHLANLVEQAVTDAPLAGVLASKVLDLAEWYAETRRPRNVPQSVTDKHKAAVDWFVQVSKGLVHLGADVTPTETTRIGGHVAGNPRVWTRDDAESL